MGMQCVDVARIDDQSMDKVHALESELGVEVVPFEPGCRWADLDQDQLTKLRQAEKDMGIILLAYERH